MKYLRIDLPDMNEDESKISPEKMRQKMKERGVLPPRPWMERPFYISSTGLYFFIYLSTLNCTCCSFSSTNSDYKKCILPGGVFEGYVPPEGDGKASFVSTTRAKQTVELLEKKSKSMMAIRKIKSYDEDYDAKEFAQEAQRIYINAHESLANNDKYALRKYVTEKAYPEFRHNSHLKTIRWKFLDSLEPPRVVHARCTDIISKENIFAQVWFSPYLIII